MTITTWKGGPTQAPLPPMMNGLPILGNALELAQDVLSCMLKGYRQHGPIFRIQALGETYTVIAGPEANLFFSREQGQHLRSKEFWAGIDQEMEANITLISSDGPDHTELRQISKRGYSRSLYEAHFPEVVEITRQKVAEWPVGESRSVVPWVQEVVTEQLGRVIVGTAPGDYGKDIYNFIRTALLVLITRQRPGFLLKMPAYQNARRRSFELGQRIVAYHRANPPVDRPANLIDDALAAVKAGRVLSDADLVPFALGPYIAGLDTSSNSIAFMLYAIFKHPEILSGIRDEVNTLFSNGVPAPSDLRQVDILHRTALETLRCYPVVPAIQRTVTEPFEFAGHRVDAGQRLFIATTAVHFDERYHPDPDRFDIDRYLPPRNEHRTPGAFAPYGLGAHSCLGAGLAEAQIMLTIAAMFHFGQFEMDPLDYKLKIRPLPTNAPANNFRLKRVG
ncbi:MAG: cytochrome P450 [Anaerolineales bacterium]